MIYTTTTDRSVPLRPHMWKRPASVFTLVVTSRTKLVEASRFVLTCGSVPLPYFLNNQSILYRMKPPASEPTSTSPGLTVLASLRYNHVRCYTSSPQVCTQNLLPQDCYVCNAVAVTFFRPMTTGRGGCPVSRTGNLYCYYCLSLSV